MMTFSYGEIHGNVLTGLFLPPVKMGTIIFIHGGYWQSCNKEDFAFITAGPLARGFDVMLLEYTLAPQTR
jgi:acetyl esterase/lipase